MPSHVVELVRIMKSVSRNLNACRSGQLAAVALAFGFSFAVESQSEIASTDVDIREGGCNFSQGETDETIIVGNLVRDNETVTPGAVLISGGHIKKIDTKEEVLGAAPNSMILDCADSFISPGFINPHEHLSHSGGLPDP